VIYSGFGKEYMTHFESDPIAEDDKSGRFVNILALAAGGLLLTRYVFSCRSCGDPTREITGTVQTTKGAIIFFPVCENGRVVVETLLERNNTPHEFIPGNDTSNLRQK